MQRLCKNTRLIAGDPRRQTSSSILMEVGITRSHLEIRERLDHNLPKSKPEAAIVKAYIQPANALSTSDSQAISAN